MHTTPVTASEALQSTPAQKSLLLWLDMLRQLYPPCGVMLVGAGSGSSPWVQYLMTANWLNVTLIEADEATACRLKATTQSQPSWQVLSHVIGPNNAPTLFYSASLHTESGLLEPESLRSLWPNLKTTHKQTRQAIALAELQQDAEPPANWLMLDCLPALPIIQGAAQQLAAFDVIAVRVLLNENAPQASASTADELQPVLQALGFRCLIIETSRHPALGHALFVRDTAAQASHLQQQLSQQAQTNQAQAQDLAQAKAAADKLASGRIAQIQAHEQRLQQLQAHSAESDHLRQLLQAELNKAEAQIELLKEIFIRETGQ